MIPIPCSRHEFKEIREISKTLLVFEGSHPLKCPAANLSGADSFLVLRGKNSVKNEMVLRRALIIRKIVVNGPENCIHGIGTSFYINSSGQRWNLVHLQVTRGMNLNPA